MIKFKNLPLGSVYTDILAKVDSIHIDVFNKESFFENTAYQMEIDGFNLEFKYIQIYFYYQNICIRISNDGINITEKFDNKNDKPYFYKNKTWYKKANYRLYHSKIIWYAFKQIINNLKLDVY
jgi:hypothetical protein